MARFLALRTVYMILVMIGISILVFALSRMSGDPRYLYMTPGTRWSAEVWEARGKALGLDKPLVIQYLLWAGGAVRGDFGESIWHKRNSLKVIRERTLGWLASAGITRITRSALLEVLDSEYVKLARAKGVGQTKVIFKHALKNALVAPLTVAAILFASFITGTVVVETVFAWPGLGRLAVEATLQSDFPLVTGLTVIFAAVFLLSSLTADLLYAYIDPRIRIY